MIQLFKVSVKLVSVKLLRIFPIEGIQFVSITLAARAAQFLFRDRKQKSKVFLGNRTKTYTLF